MKYVEDHWAVDGRNRILAVLVGLSPIWFAIFAFLTRTPFGGGFPTPPTELRGLDARLASFVIFALAAVLSSAGAAAIWRARSRRIVIGAFLLLTLPALILVILAPAFVLILTNLDT